MINQEKLDLFADEVGNEVLDLGVETLPKKVAMSYSCGACLSSFSSGTSTAGTFSSLTTFSSAG